MREKIPQHVRGVLDPKSFAGRGTVIEYVVLEARGDCTKQKFNYKYDLYSEKLGKINVKSSILKYMNNTQYWVFNINPNGYVPDYYVCVALDQYYANLSHVWEIPGTSNVVRNKEITVRNSEKGLERFKEYEVDVSKYNEIYKTLDITKYPEFNNLDKNDTSLFYVSYDWDKDPVITYFNRETGVVSTEKEENSLVLDRDLYPLYDNRGVYRGYVENDKFIDICDEKFQSFLKYALRGYTNVSNHREKEDELPLIIQIIRDGALNHKYVLLCLVQIALKHKLPIKRYIVIGRCINQADKYGMEFIGMKSVNAALNIWDDMGVIEATKSNIRRIGNDECTIQDIENELYKDTRFAKFRE